MNAHQRRIRRRSRNVVVFDIEAIRPRGTRLSNGGLVPQDLFFWPSVDSHNSVAVRILKERQPKQTGERFTFYPDADMLDMDFSKLEERIEASMVLK